ncbi:sialidase family protein [Dactylosporangium sp. NPDC049140]|uniref:sialidase family protein n=1 Tax=Dactylosporangium sp. NPDC049140 TaxID=3155647 RepID=UPI0033D07C4B
MTSLRELFDDAAAVAPPSRLSGREVYAAAWRRRRARQRWAAAAAGGLTALVVAAVVAMAANRAPQSGPATTTSPRPSAPAMTNRPALPAEGVQESVAGEGHHLYVQWAPYTCDNMSKHGCPGRLLGSDDGGATWTERYRGVLDFISAPAPGVVTAHFDGDPDIETKHVSTDGGRTWKLMRLVAGTVAAVPAGGWAVCTDERDPNDNNPGPYECVLRGVDPRTGEARPLAHQPGVQPGTVLDTPNGAGLWISGTAADGHLAVAVSHDGGQTWRTHPFPESDPADPGFTSVATIDGTSAYAVVMTGSPRRVAVYRTTDGGQGWTAADPGHTVPYKDHGQDTYLAADGTHVIRTVHPKLAGWYAGRGDAYTAPAPVTGLSDHDGFWPVVVLAPGSYVTSDMTSVYTSPDGLRWTRVPIRAGT